jgi:hypothetical protein
MSENGSEMGIKQTLDVINEMERNGVIERYAMAGAVAAYNYAEPALVEHLDILVSLERRSVTNLRRKAHHLGGDWHVCFRRTTDNLDREALRSARPVDLHLRAGKTVARVLRPEYIVAMAVRDKRLSDLDAITRLFERHAVSPRKLKAVLVRHKLEPAWRALCRKMGWLGIQSRGSVGKATTNQSNLLAAVLAMKEEAREFRADLSLGEKIERMEALRERVRPLKQAREQRRRKTGSTALEEK